MGTEQSHRLTITAGVVAVLLAGLNGIGVRFTVMELPPFWGAALRFAPASMLLLAAVFFLHLPIPRGRALLGTLLYGILNIGASFAFIYWGLQVVQAGMSQTILALVPLLTMFFAIAHRQEKFRWQALVGALLALGGVALVFGEQLQADVPLLSLLAVLLGAACMAESGVIMKGFPKSHPITTNALAMAVGSIILLSISYITGESQAMPTLLSTWIALAYLIVFGSCVVFILFLYVLKRWTASATSYMFVLLPFVTVAASARLTGERVSLAFLIGGALVLAGVYIGAIAALASERQVHSTLPQAD